MTERNKQILSEEQTKLATMTPDERTQWRKNVNSDLRCYYAVIVLFILAIIYIIIVNV